jgi:hypothetical protein
MVKEIEEREYKVGNKPKTGESRGDKTLLRAIRGCRRSRTARKAMKQLEAISLTQTESRRQANTHRERRLYVFNGVRVLV